MIQRGFFNLKASQSTLITESSELEGTSQGSLSPDLK